MSSLLYATVAQTRYLEKATSEKGVMLPSFLEQIKKDRAALEDPEASWDLADLIASGKTNPQIEQELFIAPGTLKAHIQHIYVKCGVHSRKELVEMCGGGA